MLINMKRAIASLFSTDRFRTRLGSGQVYLVQFVLNNVIQEGIDQLAETLVIWAASDDEVHASSHWVGSGLGKWKTTISL